MELLTLLKEMNHMNTILYQGLNIKLLSKYLERNNIGKLYEPIGDYFEEIVQNILDELETLTPQEITLIINIHDIMKYPLKTSDQNSDTANKIKIINIISPDAKILWINEIKTRKIDFNINNKPYYLKSGETSFGGSSIIWKSECLIRMDERNEEGEIDITLIKHPIVNLLYTKWTLDKKEFEGGE